MSLRVKAAIKLLITIALVALATVLAKSTLTRVHYFDFVWLQMVFASVAMLVITLFIRRESLWVKAPLKIWLMVASIGLLNFSIVRAIFIFALDTLPVTTHAYIINFVGLVTMGLSVVLLREMPTFLQVAGAIIALSGVRLYFFELPESNQLVAIAWLSFAVFCLALTNILIRKLHLLEQANFSANQVSTIAILSGSLPLAFLGFAGNGQLADISINDWLIIGFNGFIGVALVMIVFNQVLKILMSFEASILATSGVIFTAVFAYFLLGDQLALYEILGILVMFVGISLVQFFNQKKLP